MKYIKKFENVNKSFKIGDYVLMNIKVYNKDFENFINDTIGKIVNIDPIQDVFGKITDYEIVVSFTNVPDELKDIFIIYSEAVIINNYKGDYRRRFNMEDIVASGKTPEEVKLKQNAIKYNL